MSEISIYKQFFICIIVVIATVAKAQKPKILATVQNTTNELRQNELVSISWETIIKKQGAIDTAMFSVVNTRTGKVLPHQFETLGTGSIQNLLVQITVQSKETVVLAYSKKKSQVFPSKTYGRFVPERKDDFTWENDRIAFRMYGKALEATPKEMAYGIDVWVKRTDKMVINDRYKKADYHNDNGDGLDYYHVGLTLGAGNMMPILGDSICYSRNFVAHKILDNGPLRTTFRLFYEEWQVGTKKVKATKTICLDAGSQFNKITIDYTHDDFKSNDILPVVAGIILRKGKGIKYLDEIKGIMAYWEPEYSKDGTTGVACIFENTIDQITETKDQLLAHTHTNTKKMITYYAGAAWNKAGVYTDGGHWLNHVQQFQKLINTPLLVY